jgi:hypothetical protein
VGLALYRTGAYRQVLDTLSAANAGTAQSQTPVQLAVLAMASHQLQQSGKAQEFLAQARKLMKNPIPAGQSDYYARVVGEAEKVVENR